MEGNPTIANVMEIKAALKSLLYMFLWLPLIIIPILGTLFLVTASPFFASAKCLSSLHRRDAYSTAVIMGIVWGLILWFGVIIIERIISFYPSSISSAHIMLGFVLCFTSAVFSYLGARNPL